jgi:hypothetical protein
MKSFLRVYKYANEFLREPDVCPVTKAMMSPSDNNPLGTWELAPNYQQLPTVSELNLV